MVILRSRIPKNFYIKIQLFLISNYPYFDPGPLTQDPKKWIPPPLALKIIGNLFTYFKSYLFSHMSKSSGSEFEPKI